MVDSTKVEVVGHWADAGASQRDPPEQRGEDPLRRQRQPQHRLGLRREGRQGGRDDRHGDRPQRPPGSTPSSLALTPDEELLFVANANTNDVAVVNVKELGDSKPLGFIPAGWYPTSVRVARDGKTLYIANGKGTSSKANRDGPNPLAERNAGVREYIAGLFQGSLSILPIPGPKEMLAHSKTVYECSPLRARATEGVP